MNPTNRPLCIAVDFDGTCVTHEYPAIGRDVGAVPVLKALVAKGHRLILNTMRSGVYLADAEKWFAENNIPLYGVNENPNQKSWTTSPKVEAHYYIDDAALGVPLLAGKTRHERNYVDWEQVESFFAARGVL